jgi:cyclic pyranopterin phosphate synthase
MPFVIERGGLLHGEKLEYNLVDHCNLSCRECSHLSPYVPKNALPFEVFERDLQRVASVFRVQRFRFVGGEPLLHKDLLRFIVAVRESGIAPRIEIASNGVLVPRAPDELFEAIDSLSLSIYPSAPCEPDVMRAIEQRCRQHGVALKVDFVGRFRRMQVRKPMTDDKLVRSIFNSCLIAHTWGCQTFYDGHFYLCSRPIYTDSFIGKLGLAPEELRTRDGVPLHEPDLRARLLTYLRSREPLNSCRYCLGAVGEYEPHQQLTAAQRKSPASEPAPTELGVNAARMRHFETWHAMKDGVLHAIPSAKLSRVLNALTTAAVGD